MHQLSAKGSSYPSMPSIDIASDIEPAAGTVWLGSILAEVNASLVDSYFSLYAGDKKSTVFDERIVASSISVSESSILDLLLELRLKLSCNSS